MSAPNPKELRVGELLRRLKVNHLWAVLGAIVALVVAAFSLGFQAHALVSDVGAKRAVVSDTKHEFFTRYNRYVTARDNYERSRSPETREPYELAERMLVDLVERWWADQNAFSGELDFQPEVIRKGFDPTKSRVVFADGAEFIIPPEIKQKVLEAE